MAVHWRGADFKDGPEYLLLVNAGDEFAVSWTKPADLPYAAERDVPLFRNYGGLAAFADGTVRWVNGGLDPQVLRALITRDGGERLQESSPGVCASTSLCNPAGTAGHAWLGHPRCHPRKSRPCRPARGVH